MIGRDLHFLHDASDTGGEGQQGFDWREVSIGQQHVENEQRQGGRDVTKTKSWCADRREAAVAADVWILGGWLGWGYVRNTSRVLVFY